MRAARRRGAAGGSAAARPAACRPERRCRIYRNNLQASLGAALEAVYPGRRAARRRARAFAMSRAAHVAAHPSRSGNLHEFGARLPAFLRSQPRSRLAYLADVAALEWAGHEVYHEADDVALDPAALAALPVAAPGAAAPGTCSSATRFVASAYPVLAIWQANQPRTADAAALRSTQAACSCSSRAAASRSSSASSARPRTAGCARSPRAGTLGRGRARRARRRPPFDLGAALAGISRSARSRAWSLAPEETERRAPEGDHEATRGAVIEDDPDIGRLITLQLAELDCESRLVADGVSGLAEAQEGRFDLVILDIMLPRLDGLQICRRLRAAEQHTPILMLTAKSSELDGCSASSSAPTTT
jgi:CheY-like chemotaxis protein